MRTADVAVVGAGPYGLSVAAHLRARGVRPRVFGRPMDTWISHMPRGMLLKSEGFASNLSDPGGKLTLRAFAATEALPYADIGWSIPVENFAGYGLWFAERAVPELEQTEVRALRRRPDGYELELEGGETLPARRVVVATGFASFPYLPKLFDGLSPELVSHTADHDRYDQFAGREVAVVGGGQSALEAAALLREQEAMPRVVLRTGSVAWTGRIERERPLTHRIRWPISPLGTGLKLWACSNLAPAFRLLPAETRIRLARETLGPAGAWWLRDRLAEAVPLLLEHEPVSARPEDGRIRLELAARAGTVHMTVDHVLAGTGYRVDLERLRFLDGDIRDRLMRVGGAPRLSANFESSVPGLYFVGFAAAPSFGPVMRFVCGARLAATRIARHVAGD